MTDRTITLLPPTGGALQLTARPDAEHLWLSAADLAAVTGFELKPEGLCRGELCYPLPPGRESEFVSEGSVNVAAFWRHRGGAVVHTDEGDTWALGDALDEKVARQESLEAPDFTLPDADGKPHRLSDYRGKKVLLTTWASWCGCRHDLPVWQRLTEEVGADNLTVVAVALDSAPGAAEPWIEKAAPTYPALIDRDHRVAELYNLVNVPQAVWIDESGHVVRPPEPAGAFDFLNKRDPNAGMMTPELMERSRETRLMYLNALKDWVANGEASQYAYSEEDARAKTETPDATVLRAHASFRLGQYLVANGRESEGRGLVEEAKRLHPDSWAMFREAAEKLDSGIAAGPDFMARLAERAAANQPYYDPIDIEGIPS